MEIEMTNSECEVTFWGFAPNKARRFSTVADWDLEASVANYPGSVARLPIWKS